MLEPFRDFHACFYLLLLACLRSEGRTGHAWLLSSLCCGRDFEWFTWLRFYQYVPHVSTSLLAAAAAASCPKGTLWKWTRTNVWYSNVHLSTALLIVKGKQRRIVSPSLSRRINLPTPPHLTQKNQHVSTPLLRGGPSSVVQRPNQTDWLALRSSIPFFLFFPSFSLFYLPPSFPTFPPTKTPHHSHILFLPSLPPPPSTHSTSPPRTA